jgi:uncharacterized protein with von Willebrand factor type A (vWA) domain
MSTAPRPIVFSHRWRYGRFDGSSSPLVFDADDVLSGLSDDLLYHGDLAAALRRLLQEGFETKAGEHVQGIEEMMKKIADRKKQLGSKENDLAQRVAQALDEVLGLERSELDGRNDESSLMAGMQLELLPDDLLGKISQLMEYDFASTSAQERFDQLLDELRHDLIQQQLDAASSQLANASPEEQAHLREGLDALNELIEQRAQGEDVDEKFKSYMDEFGDLFPGNPASLDELIAQLAQRMAAASSMMSSMSPDQRAQFGALSDQLLSDIDLAWQMDRLGSNLRDAMPEISWEQHLGESGNDPFSLLGDLESVSELAALGELEHMLSQGGNPDQLHELDQEQVAALVGEDVARSIEALAQLTRRLEEAGLIARKEGQLQLTPAGVRHLGSQALQELFARLRHDRVGNHPVPSTGIGHDQSGETKLFEYGDPFRLDLQRTLRNAMLRQAQSGMKLPNLPLALTIDDFEVEQTEHLTTSSTVLAIDLSLSMPMEDNFLSAKKVAIALQSLIASRFPRDYLGLVGFSATAREISPMELPSVSWDFAYGTNLEHALKLGRSMLKNESGTKQIIVITDGEPTAHIEDNGEVFFNYPAAPETIERTMREVLRCTNDHVVINTFVLNSTGALRSFVERMTRMNKGRAFYTTPDALGDYVLVDFVKNHSQSRKHLRPGT